MVDPRSGRIARTLSSLAGNRGFRRYFFAQFASNIGTRIQMATTAWLVLQMTGSSLQMGLVLASEVLPILILAPLAGRIVDLYSARRVAVVTQTVLALIVFAFIGASGADSYATIVALSVIFGAVAAFDGVARQVIVVELVPPAALQSAFSWSSVSANGSAFIGPAIAGVLLAGAGAMWCFALNGMTFLAVAIVIATIQTASETSRGSENLSSFVSALKYTAALPFVGATMIAVALIAAFTYEFPITLPLLVSEEYGDAATSYGLLLAASGLGAIVGGLKTAGDEATSRTALPLAALGLAASVAATAGTGTVWWGTVTLFFTGAFSTQFLAMANTRVFAGAPSRIRGRLGSLWQVATVGTTVIGGPLVGAFADECGARAALIAGAVVATCSVGIMLLGLHRMSPLTEQNTGSGRSYG